MKNIRRFKYYGGSDLATMHDLPRARKRLKQLAKGTNISSLDDAFEVYNAVIAFEDLLSSLAYSDEEKQEIATDLIPLGNQSVGKFFNNLTEKDLLQMASDFDMEYQEDFFLIAKSIIL